MGVVLFLLFQDVNLILKGGLVLKDSTNKKVKLVFFPFLYIHTCKICNVVKSKRRPARGVSILEIVVRNSK